MDRTGQTLLGKYELTRLLGRGGMGEVWEGEHAVTGRRVAIKVLSEKYLSNQKVVKRFGREARAASAVDHPGIVEILDHDRTPEGVPFLVMEFLQGESLGDRLRDRVKLSQEEAVDIMLSLLDALDAAHTHGVVHRDLKPDNVFLLPGSRAQQSVKILDFGISRKADEIDHKLTQEGSVLGTPHYMSPEQARGDLGIDARADIYAAGVLLYELVVGDVPFDAGNYNALLQTILTTPPVAPRRRGANISEAVEQVVLMALEKDRDKRPSNARDFRVLLERARDAPAAATRDPGMARGPSSRPGPTGQPAPDEAAPLPSLPPLDEPVDPFGRRPAAPAPGHGVAGLSRPPAIPSAPPEPLREPSIRGGVALPPSRFDVSDAPPPSAPVLDLQSNAEAAAEQARGPLSLDVEPSVRPPPRGASTPPLDLSGPASAGATAASRSKGQPSPPKTPAAAPGHVASPLRSARGSSRLVRTAVSWVVAAVVLALVIVVVGAMFERDDPRRRQPIGAEEAAASE